MTHGNPIISCIIGGQYGSEGKGAIAGYLANDFDVAVRVGAPNAGHTLQIGKQVWKMQQIPVAGLINPDIILCIGAAGLINLKILKRELGYIKDYEGRFFIDRNAGILEEHHREQEEKEKMFEGIGSTCEGVGAALKDKISRKKGEFKTAKDIDELKPYIINVAEFISELPANKKVMIEGTQGHALSLNHGPYPYCTSRDIIASSLLSDVGIAPKLCKEVIMVVRTYPIRVAGNSGPMYNEITWEEVTKRSEYDSPLIEKTTVTKRVRRVGEFDMDMVQEAVNLSRPDWFALTFADYISHENFGVTEYDSLTPETHSFVELLESATKVPVGIIKTGPDFKHIIDLRSKRFHKHIFKGGFNYMFDEGNNV